MNDLLIFAVPFAAFVALFFAWLNQNRKVAPVRVAQPVRRVSQSATAMETERGGVQVPA